MTPDQRAQTRALNDRLRRHRCGGYIVFSPRIQAAWDMRRKRALLNVIGAKHPSQADDPTGERAFGRVLYRGQRIFWRIDYDLIQWAPGQPQLAFEPWTDELGCNRALSIMFSEERQTWGQAQPQGREGEIEGGCRRSLEALPTNCPAG